MPAPAALGENPAHVQLVGNSAQAGRAGPTWISSTTAATASSRAFRSSAPVAAVGTSLDAGGAVLGGVAADHITPTTFYSRESPLTDKSSFY
jgi:hypothetical protein